jgi:hypothetical protein
MNNLRSPKTEMFQNKTIEERNKEAAKLHLLNIKLLLAQKPIQRTGGK